MKIAVVTNNGETISQHFGRSPYYKIYTVEDGDPVSVEMRERKTGHFATHQGDGDHHHEDHNHAGGHGFGAEADRKHLSMAKEISDCNVLIAGGMGRGAYEQFQQAGLEVIVTDLREIDDAIIQYLAGELHDQSDIRTH